MLIILVTILLSFIILILKMKKLKKTEEIQSQKIQNLEAYNKTLSIMYDKIRGFRHDFCNFVMLLDGYSKDEDIEGVRKLSEAALSECLDINSLAILDPKIINNAAIYNILSNKYYIAQKDNIYMQIDIVTDLKDEKICNYDVYRILGILLDNAIEAAKECEEKKVYVRFMNQEKANRKIIIVENSYNTVKNIDLEAIFEKGYSSKINDNKEHGLGLWNVKRILNKTKNLNLYTNKDKLFTQQLEIY